MIKARIFKEERKHLLNIISTTKTSSIVGLTLIEVIISMTILSVLLIVLVNIFNFNLDYWVDFNRTLEAKRNVNIVKVFIEKRIREFNQRDIFYDHRNKTIKGRNSNGNISQINLSGKKTYDYNTLIYFYKDNKEVRVNKKGEHNVLAKHIKNITIKEVIPEKLIEIEIFSELIDYSIKINLRIN